MAYRSSNWIRSAKRNALYAVHKCECAYCGVQCSPSQLTLDHVIARTRGGSHHAGNLVVACKTCNSAKKELSLEAFILYLKVQGLAPGKVRARVLAQQAMGEIFEMSRKRQSSRKPTVFAVTA